MTFAKSGYTVTRQGVQSLLEMLMTKRPAFSAMDDQFIQTYLRPLGVVKDEYGNLYKKVGKDPIVAWSSHTDTVHRHGGYQFITKSEPGIVKLHDKSDSNCLGADDTTGVWLMVEMIKADRPGLYIFHRSEERGGLGGRWIVKHTPELVTGVQSMVALDRKANDSVITFQAGGRCCSDTFGESLADQMLDACGPYKLDQGGSFTDSASYTDLVPECTNLSVGYNYQHSRSEELDLDHIIKVREALINLDARDLSIVRKAGEKEVRTYQNYNYNRGASHNHSHHSSHSRTSSANSLGQYLTDPNYVPDGFNGGYWSMNKWIHCGKAAWEAQRDFIKRTMKKESKTDTGVKAEAEKLDKANITQGKMSRKMFAQKDNVYREYTMLDVVKDFPLLVTAMLTDWGFDAACLMEEVLQRKESFEETGCANTVLPTKTPDATKSEVKSTVTD